MKKMNFSGQSWYPYTVATCAAVALYVALEHISLVFQFIAMIGNFVYPIIAGAVIAYLMNPLMMWFRRKVFHKIEKIELRKSLSLLAAVGVVFFAIVFLLLTLIPQLISSITNFLGSFDGYIERFGRMVQSAATAENTQGVLDKIKDFVDSLTGMIAQNSGGLFSAASSVGGHVAAWGIGFILAVYFLSGKEKIKTSAKIILKELRISSPILFLGS